MGIPFVQMQGDHAHGMGAVHHYPDATLTADFRQFLHRRHHARRPVHVPEDQGRRTLVYSTFEYIDDLLLVGDLHGQMHPADGHAVPFGHVVEAGVYRAVFLVRHQDFSAYLPGHALGEDAERHGGVLDQRDALRPRANEFRQLLPRFLDDRPVLLLMLQRVAVEGPDGLGHAIHDRLR